MLIFEPIFFVIIPLSYNNSDIFKFVLMIKYLK